MRKQQSGFGIVGIILIIMAVLISIGAIGYYLYNRANHDEAPIASSQNAQQIAESSQQAKEADMPKELSLANDSVIFTLPNTWTFTQGTEECRHEDDCVSAANITPGEELPTRYNKGKDHFKINISVYKNPDKMNAQQWLESGMGEKVIEGEVNELNETVNGYNAYYRDLSYEKNGATIRQVEYSFTKGLQAIVIYARTFDTGVLPGGRSVGDFRKFESDIDEMARSIGLDPQRQQ